MTGAAELSVRTDRGDAADRASIAAVHEAAFGGLAEAHLVEALRAGSTWRPELSLVAEHAGSVVGHVAFTVVLARGHEVAALAPLGVLPQHQGSGVGSALVWEGLARCDVAGLPMVLVLGDPRYYVRFGFRAAREVGLNTPAGWTEVAFQALTLRSYDPNDWPAGGEVAYPEAFFAGG